MSESGSERPIIILPDTSPLIHLAAGGLLDLLTALGRVILVDVVMLEATSDQSKPMAAEIKAWLDDKLRPGSNARVEVAESDLGAQYRSCIELGLPKPRGSGEYAILGWLDDQLDSLGGPVLVVYEDRRIPRLLTLERTDAQLSAATTRSFLDFAQERGVLASAEQAWRAIVSAAPTVSRDNVFTRMGGPDRE